MTDAEWLASTDVEAMLRDLFAHLPPTPANDRRLRLLACACARLVLPLCDDSRCRDSVEMAERFARRQTDRRTMDKANRRAAAVAMGNLSDWQEVRRLDRAHAVQAAVECSRPQAIGAAYRVATAVGVGMAWSGEVANLVREFFGVPTESADLPDGWKRWNGGIIPRMAAEIAEDDRFDELPVLADALEEAGCRDARLLAHLRGPGPHVAGCWALEALTEET